ACSLARSAARRSALSLRLSARALRLSARSFCLSRWSCARSRSTLPVSAAAALPVAISTPAAMSANMFFIVVPLRPKIAQKKKARSCDFHETGPEAVEPALLRGVVLLGGFFRVAGGLAVGAHLVLVRLDLRLVGLVRVLRRLRQRGAGERDEHGKSQGLQLHLLPPIRVVTAAPLNARAEYRMTGSGCLR